LLKDAKTRLTRREFLKAGACGLFAPIVAGADRPFISKSLLIPQFLQNAVFAVRDVPDQPFLDPDRPNIHIGVEALLSLMGRQKLKFYRTRTSWLLGGPLGLISPRDVVLIKVNAQWKYRGATNSDVVRGLVQHVLDHPDGFVGEIVIFENGQGRGSLACDTTGGGAYPDASVHANAVDERQSFTYLVNSTFKDPRVSAFLLDNVRGKFLGPDDHATNGYRKFENVSYPCFTTAGGHRIELREGLWNGAGFDQNLKLINVPVLKTHGGSEFTGALKHFYGVLSMSDGQSDARHYGALGETVGKMAVSVRTPVLNIMDAVWVSHAALGGNPPSATFKANRLVASQDPLALDYWSAKHILYPGSGNSRHDPDNAVISEWMEAAAAVINGRGGLFKLEDGILAKSVTRDETRMTVFESSAV
jgi:uncharacterized protein (DUF362 family)